MKEGPFLRRLTNLSSVIIQKYHQPDQDWQLQQAAAAYSQKEQYTVDALLALGEIETVYDQLEQSPYFLANFRQTQALKSKGIARFDHIIYHIESHLFRATGILDRMLLLINCIFELQLPPEKAKAYNILTDKKGNEGKYASVMKSFDSTLYNNLLDLLKVIDKHRDARNEISHQKRYNNKKLNTIEMFHILQTSHNPDFTERHYLYFAKQEADKVVKVYKEKMLKFNNKIRSLIDAIYTGLENRWVTEYQNK